LPTGAARQRDRWAEALRRRRKAAGRRAPRSDSAIVAALGSLADVPAFRTRDLADRLGVTWRAALDAVTELEAAGIIRQVSAGRGNRLYEAAEVFTLLDHFEDSPASFVDARRSTIAAAPAARHRFYRATARRDLQPSTSSQTPTVTPQEAAGRLFPPRT
jgi:ribosomal protein S25